MGWVLEPIKWDQASPPNTQGRCLVVEQAVSHTLIRLVRDLLSKFGG